MEHQADEQQMEAVHLRKRRLQPQRAGEGQGQPRRGGDERPHSQAGREKDRDGDAPRGRNRRQQAGPKGDGPNRQQAEEFAGQDEERVAGRVGDAQSGGNGLALCPVPNAHARQERPQVDEEGQRGTEQGSQLRWSRRRELGPASTGTNPRGTRRARWLEVGFHCLNKL